MVEDNQSGEPEVTETEDIEALREALAEARAQAESQLDSWKRAQADFINYKRRSEQEKEEIGRFGNTTIMLSAEGAGKTPLGGGHQTYLVQVPFHSGNPGGNPDKGKG